MFLSLVCKPTSNAHALTCFRWDGIYCQFKLFFVICANEKPPSCLFCAQKHMANIHEKQKGYIRSLLYRRTLFSKNKSTDIHWTNTKKRKIKCTCKIGNNYYYTWTLCTLEFPFFICHIWHWHLDCVLLIINQTLTLLTHHLTPALWHDSSLLSALWNGFEVSIKKTFKTLKWQLFLLAWITNWTAFKGAKMQL